MTALPLYSGPIAVTATTHLQAVAFDPAGNVSTVLDETYVIDRRGASCRARRPSAPPSAGVGEITLNWSIDPAFTVTDYSVQREQRRRQPAG